jgi:hypothetical protein
MLLLNEYYDVGKLLDRHREFIPFFRYVADRKHSSFRRWAYIGDFRVYRSTEQAGEIRQELERHDLAKRQCRLVLWLESRKAIAEREGAAQLSQVYQPDLAKKAAVENAAVVITMTPPDEAIRPGHGEPTLMNLKKRRMSFIPEVNPKSFVLYFEKGVTGRSWSIRDYSVERIVKRFGPANLPWTAREIQERTVLSLDAPAVRAEDLAFWCDHTRQCNEQHAGLLHNLQPSSLVATSKVDNSTTSVRRLDGSSHKIHPRAFVSHSTQDHLFVEKFAADLRTNGVDVWFSKWEIKAGDSIRAKIEEGLDGCEYFIIVLSKNSMNGPWVHKELDAATVRNIGGNVRKIIPVRIEDCGDLPPGLASLCWEDFSNQPYDAAVKRVLESIFDIDLKPRIGSPPTDSGSGVRGSLSISQSTKGQH